MPELKSELLFEMSISIAEMYTIGDSGKGERWFAGQTGGKFSGPHLRGEILDAGGDIGLRRPDGVTEHDIHAVLRTDDAATIYLNYTGVGHQLSLAPLGPESEPGFYFRVAVRFETGAEQYAWLNRIVGVGVPQCPAEEEYHIGWRIYAVL